MHHTESQIKTNSKKCFTLATQNMLHMVVFIQHKFHLHRTLCCVIHQHLNIPIGKVALMGFQRVALLPS